MKKKSLQYLTLCPSLEWLQDVSFDEDLSLKTIVVMSRSDIEKIPCDVLKEKFGAARAVKNYADDHEVKTMIRQCHQDFAFQKIIAPDEEDILRAAFLRQELNLDGQSYESALAFRDKTRMKEVLSQANVLVPPFRKIEESTELSDFAKTHGYPLILKPCRATGCRGIYVLDHEKDIRAAVQVVQNAPPSFYQVEAFIRGEMYHVDGLVIQGKLACSWPSLYFHPPLNMIQGKGASSYMLAADNPLTSTLNHYAEKILGLMPTPQNTAFHLEFFISPTDREPVFCEIASRVGGKGVNQAWKSSFGLDLKQSFVRMNYGVDLPPLRMPVAPFHLAGEIWFPCLRGKVESVPDHCPFLWVRQWEISVKVGEVLAPGEDIDRILGGSSLITASSEQEMQERMTLFSQWFYAALGISDPEKHFSDEISPLRSAPYSR